MLRQCLKKAHTSVSIKSQCAYQSSVFRASRVFSTKTMQYYQATKKTPEVTTEESKFNRRYVEVDSPLARANKYTYAMPDDPYVASERVGKILEIGTVDDAADYIKALPMYLQSAIVWNQLLGQCAKYGRANYAEQYYTQMRKRGIEPNERTFTHLLHAYSKSNSPNAIASAEARKKLMQDFNMKPSTIHYNNLMRVYNNANAPYKTIRALKELSDNGELVPDAITYSIALQACVRLKANGGAEHVNHVWQDMISRLEKNSRSTSSNGSLLAQKASNIIWTEDSIRSNKKNGKDAELEVDDTLVVSLLSAVTQTAVNERDMLIGVEALDRLYSLCPPLAADMMEKNGIQRKHGFGFQPSVKVLDAILRFTGGLGEYKLGGEYFHLALQQYPRIEPDKYVYDAFNWIEKQIKRGQNYEKKRQNRHRKRSSRE